jgi:hypothetical protein
MHTILCLCPIYNQHRQFNVKIEIIFQRMAPLK